jgi:aryl sulfotransferase
MRDRDAGAGMPRRYQYGVVDSRRWDGFPFRRGDIVISAPPKSGTTWMQMICALLIFQTRDLPAPLTQLSPWLDCRFEPRDEVYAALAAQEHRRFVKTHTPLDGIPADPGVTYIVVGRHPLDVAVSSYHMDPLIDFARVHQLTGEEPPPRPLPPVRPWLLEWISRDRPLPALLWHLADAWNRRDNANVILAHYDDLSADLAGQMRRLARILGIAVPGRAWPGLVRAATFGQMRSDATRLAPNHAGILKDNGAFFRQGNSGAGRELLSSSELTHYFERVASLAPADLLAWLHRDEPRRE